MPEDPKEEHKETPETQGTQATANGAPTAEELAAMKAELDQEKKAIAAAQTMITEKDARIAELEAQLGEAKKGSEATTAELTRAKEAHTKAVAKYLDAVKLANTSLPGDVLAGATIEEIDASVARAQAIAESVKKSIEAQARQTRVPAGAPPRSEISLEGLSPREKIAAGIQQKGGTS